MLERKLAALRKGQDGLKKTIGELNDAIAAAGSSMRMLKSAAGESPRHWTSASPRARSLADELVAAEPLPANASPNASIANAKPVKAAPPLPSASIMGRLDSGRFNALGAVR